MVRIGSLVLMYTLTSLVMLVVARSSSEEVAVLRVFTGFPVVSSRFG